MYSPIQLLNKYLRYYITASNAKGHGIHSPFVFHFIKFILNDRKQYACYSTIEQHRKQLLHDPAEIEVMDFGAGSGVIKNNKRKVKDIASSSLKPAKFSQLLFRIVQFYQPQNIVELGTSFGITTAYLSRGNTKGMVYTLEGAETIASIAKNTFKKLSAENIKLIRGDFSQTLPGLLEKLEFVDLVFIDGNHRKIPTLAYFNQFLSKCKPTSVLIFDDIHWSAEMEEAWQEIKDHNAVTLTIDIFFIGLVFINPDFKIKQHFQIRF